MDNFELRYLLLVFGGALGVYQIAAAHARLKGLCFFRSPPISYIIGLSILGVIYGWFFTQTNLKAPHPEVEGAQQLVYFLLGSFLALLVTMLFSSLNPHMGRESKSLRLGQGLEDLKARTVFQAFMQRLSKGRRR